MTNEQQKEIASIILQQLGGNMFRMMTGAKNLICGENENGNAYLSMKIGRNAKSVNYVKITLNSMDTYDVEYIRIHGMKVTVKAEENGIYNDMLRSSFERNTGMYTSL